MTDQEILTKVKEIIREHIGHAPPIDDESNIERDLFCDSLDHAEITIALESEFAVAITDEESVASKTPADFAKLISEKLK